MKKIFFLAFMFLFLAKIEAQWQKTNCPDINSINSVALKGDSIFAGTVDNMYLTTDRGANWNILYNGLPYLGNFFSTLVKGSRIFVGTDDGVYISTNNADTFALASTCSCPNVLQIILHGSDIYVITGGLSRGIFRSPDNGLSWTKLSNNLPLDVYNIYCLSFLGNEMLLGTDAGFLISANDGLTWTPLNNGLPGFKVHSIGVNGTVLFAGTENGVYRSVDTAANWTSASAGLPNNYWVGSILTIANRLIIGGPYGGGCYVSNNNGDTWLDSSSGLSSMQTLAFAYTADTMYAATGAVPTFYTGGLYKRPLSELVSLPEKEGISDFEIFPNPTEALLNITGSGLVSGYDFSISNISGQLLLKGKVKSVQAQIDLERFPAGIYFLKLEDDKGRVVKKVILY
jgi:hypothetical protein